VSTLSTLSGYSRSDIVPTSVECGSVILELVIRDGALCGGGRNATECLANFERLLSDPNSELYTDNDAFRGDTDPVVVDQGDVEVEEEPSEEDVPDVIPASFDRTSDRGLNEGLTDVELIVFIGAGACLCCLIVAIVLVAVARRRRARAAEAAVAEFDRWSETRTRAERIATEGDEGVPPPPEELEEDIDREAARRTEELMRRVDSGMHRSKSRKQASQGLAGARSSRRQKPSRPIAPPGSALASLGIGTLDGEDVDSPAPLSPSKDKKADKKADKKGKPAVADPGDHPDRERRMSQAPPVIATPLAKKGAKPIVADPGDDPSRERRMSQAPPAIASPTAPPVPTSSSGGGMERSASSKRRRDGAGLSSKAKSSRNKKQATPLPPQDPGDVPDRFRRMSKAPPVISSPSLLPTSASTTPAASGDTLELSRANRSSRRRKGAGGLSLEEYSKLTLAELISMCGARGLTVDAATVKKTDLIKQLRQDDAAKKRSAAPGGGGGAAGEAARAKYNAMGMLQLIQLATAQGLVDESEMSTVRKVTLVDRLVAADAKYDNMTMIELLGLAEKRGLGASATTARKADIIRLLKEQDAKK